MSLPRVRAAQQLSAIRTGSSLPGLFAVEGGARMVVKLRGAGAGVRALGVEVVVAALAQSLGLTVPDRAVVVIAADTPSLERHEEVLELLRASVGENLGFLFLPAARVYLTGSDTPPDADVASRIVAFDTLVMNIDRTIANPNLLVCGARLVCIDHGSVALFEHAPRDPGLRLGAPYVRQHLLAAHATRLLEIGRRLRAELTERVLDDAFAQVPLGWLDVTLARATFDARLAHFDEWLADAVVALRPTQA